MTRGDSIEIGLGLLLVAAGLSYYFGWAPVAVGLGLVLLVDPLAGLWWRKNRKRKGRLR